MNCAEPIVAGTSVDDEPAVPSPLGRVASSSLGVLKGEGDGFPDTLRGLRAAQPISRPDNAVATRRSESKSGSGTDGPVARATSSAPRALSATIELTPPPAAPKRSWRRRAAPLGTFLLGFAAGVPLTLGAERLSSKFAQPRDRRELAQMLSSAATALDEGNWDRARTLLAQSTSRAPATDRRIATLRARLALDLILANRPDEARHQLSEIPNTPRVFPAAADIQRVFAAVFVAKPSVLAAANGAPHPANPAAPGQAALASQPVAPLVKASPTRQELLSFARDRQRRSLLDDAQHLYEAVLQTRPNDAEARCGLAEVQLLRGSVADAQASFERALQSNANYVPAWVALADIDWLRGRPELAACRYQFVVAHAAAGSYPPYITQRIERVMGSGVNAPSAQPGLGSGACGN
ncbi:MAG: tetratricopeptide repeat protein [Polyangiaceae bacterium]